MSAPIRFELSWHRDFGYRVSVPIVLPEYGDRLAVREDRATEADVEALASAMWEQERHHWAGAPIWSALADELFWGGCPDAMRKRARGLLVAVFGAPSFPGRRAA